MREQSLLTANLLLKPSITALGELAITSKMATRVSFRDVQQLLASHERFIE
jgi:hypothetical protein